MRVVFAGSPGIAVPSLRALSQMEISGEGIVLAGVLSNPDSKKGRSGIPEPTEVCAEAEALSAVRQERGLPPAICLKFEKLDARARDGIAALKPDLLICFAYGRIFGPKFLSLFPQGGINIHPSLLPRYRGPAPIPAAILNRDAQTGITIQRLALQMDEGNILAQKKIPLSGRETTASLSETAAAKAAKMLPDLMRNFLSGTVKDTPQAGEAVYCPLVRKEDGRIDWNKNAEEIDAAVRAYTPWPLSFTKKGNDTLFILEGETAKFGAAAGNEPPGKVLGTDKERGILVQTGKGVYAVSRLQWQAKKALDYKAFLNGARDFAGSILG